MWLDNSKNPESYPHRCSHVGEEGTDIQADGDKYKTAAVNYGKEMSMLFSLNMVRIQILYKILIN